MPFTNATKWIKYLGINLSKETKDLYAENYKTLMKEIKDDTREMERDTMFLDWKNQFYENNHTTKTIYRFSLICIKLPMAFFTELKFKIFTICMETQKTSNSQSNLEKEKERRKNQPSWLHTIPQSYSHQDSMVLAQDTKYRPTESDKKPRGKPMHLWYLVFDKGGRIKEYTMEKRQPLQ